MGNNNMGLLGAISYIIGNIIGSGIFITPGDILNNVESVGLSLVIWVVAALIASLGAFCYVELGTSIRRSGADFAYVCYAKWYPIAFTYMCVGCILTYPATLAVQAQTFSEYIIRGTRINFSTGLESFWAKKCLSFSLIYKTENLDNLFDNSTHSPKHIVDGLFSGLFSYDGWDIINFGMEEVENPRRTMPLAIVISMTLIALFYLAMNVSYFVILAPDTVRNSDAVAIDFAQNSLGQFQYAIPFFISILLIGSLNSTMFSASRYLYAASREGHLPAFISCVNKVHDSPRVALFVHVILAMLFSFAGDLNELIQYISFAQWSQRMITMVALLYIRFWNKPVHPDNIRTPIIMPIFFFLVCTALTGVTIFETPKTALIAGALILGGLIVFTLFKWEKTLNRYEGYRKFMNKVNVKTAVFFQIVFNGMIDQGTHEDDPMEEVLREAREKKERKNNPSGYSNQALDAQTSFHLESEMTIRNWPPNDEIDEIGCPRKKIPIIMQTGELVTFALAGFTLALIAVVVIYYKCCQPPPRKRYF